MQGIMTGMDCVDFAHWANQELNQLEQLDLVELDEQVHNLQKNY